MAENIMSVSSTQNEPEVDVAEEKDIKMTDKLTLMDNVIASVAKQVASLARIKADVVEKLVVNILTTIAAINACDWYEVGIRVNGTLYRFDEYEATQAICNLVTAARIVLVDSSSAIDFNRRDAFKTKVGTVLSPGDFIQAQRQVCNHLRVNVNYHPLSRTPVMLLADANRFAVKGNRYVTDRTAECIVFLTQKFDNDPGTNISEWESYIAGKLFEFEKRN